MKVNKTTTSLPHPPPTYPISELLLSLSCRRHRKVGKGGVCQATSCLVRKGNVENYPVGI